MYLLYTSWVSNVCSIVTITVLLPFRWVAANTEKTAWQGICCYLILRAGADFLSSPDALHQTILWTVTTLSNTINFERFNLLCTSLFSHLEFYLNAIIMNRNAVKFASGKCSVALDRDRALGHVSVPNHRWFSLADAEQSR